MANDSKSHTISITLPLEQYQQVKIIAEDEDRTPSAVARRLIKIGLEDKYQ